MANYQITNRTGAQVQAVLDKFTTAASPNNLTLTGSISGGVLSVTGAISGGSTLVVGSQKSGTTLGTNAIILGNNGTASGNYSHAEGSGTTASGAEAHAEGDSTTASGWASHAEGWGTTASEMGSHAEGTSTTAIGLGAHAEGSSTTATGNNSHAEGDNAKAAELNSHAEGGIRNRLNTNNGSTQRKTIHGTSTQFSWLGPTAQGIQSHAEGTQTLAYEWSSHAEGAFTIAEGAASHVEGANCIVEGDYAHAEGGTCLAVGTASHAEGQETTGYGNYTHAGGVNSTAVAEGSFVHGACVTTAAPYGMTIGRANEEGGLSPFTIGEGSLTTDSNTGQTIADVRSTGFWINWNGCMNVKRNLDSSWVDGTTQYITNAGGDNRAAVNIWNQPADGSFYPWIRQKTTTYAWALGIIPNAANWYVACNRTSDATTNRIDSVFIVNANGRSTIQNSMNVEAQSIVNAAAGNIYIFSASSSSGYMGMYYNRTGKAGYVLTVNSAGTIVLHNTSDKRFKNDRGLLSDIETHNILSELPIINFVYKDDAENLEQSGVYAQDLRDILLKYNYKNRNYLSILKEPYKETVIPGEENQEEEENQEIEENENKEDQSKVKGANAELKDTPDVYYDLTIPEEEVYKYEMNYEALIPLLVKGWQMHEQKIQELEARIQELEGK